MANLIEVTREGRVALLRLDRQAQPDALNTALAEALVTVMEALDRDHGVDTVVLTGSPKAFAAGADISEMGGMGGTQRMTRLIGRSLAMGLHLTGGTVRPDEALRVGLVARGDPPRA